MTNLLSLNQQVADDVSHLALPLAETPQDAKPEKWGRLMDGLDIVIGLQHGSVEGHWARYRVEHTKRVFMRGKRAIYWDADGNKTLASWGILTPYEGRTAEQATSHSGKKRLQWTTEFFDASQAMLHRLRETSRMTTNLYLLISLQDQFWKQRTTTYDFSGAFLATLTRAWRVAHFVKTLPIDIAGLERFEIRWGK
jgi:hypothetical protein